MTTSMLKLKHRKNFEDYVNDNGEIYIKERPFSMPQEKI